MNKGIVNMVQSPNVWQSVKADIERKILAGTYEAGERIPSTRQIAEDYDIALSTAQKALNSLWHEGIVYAKQGVGFFVRPYVREQLISERTKALEKAVISAVEEAMLINIDIVPMVEKCMKMKIRMKDT